MTRTLNFGTAPPVGNRKAIRRRPSVRAANFLLAILFTSAIVGLPQSATAALFQVTATGTVTNVQDPFGQFPGASVGDTFTNVFVVDTSLPDENASASDGRYRHHGSIPQHGASTTVDTASGPLGFSMLSNGFYDVTVLDGAADFVQIINQDPIYSDPRIEFVQWSPLILFDSTASAFTGDEIPAILTTPGSVNLAPFNQYRMFLDYHQFTTSTHGQLAGTIQSVTVSLVPEPSSFALTALAVLGLAIVAFRRLR